LKIAFEVVQQGDIFASFFVDLSDDGTHAATEGFCLAVGNSLTIAIIHPVKELLINQANCWGDIIKYTNP
jgi:hypothetical protein